VVEVVAVDEEFTRAASVLAEVGGAGFLSLAPVEDSLVAEIVPLKVTLESGIVAGVGVMVDEFVEVTTLLSDEVEASVAVAVAGITSMALVADVLDLVMVKDIS